MTVADRFALAIFFCCVGIALCFQTAEAIRKPSGISYKICEEVAHELNNAYVEGLISEQDARRVIDNCFEALE